MTRAAQPPSSASAPYAVPGPAPARPPSRGDAIDQWLGMFTRFLRLPHAQSRAIKDELDSHMRERVRDLMLEGLSEDEGMRRAIDELGEAAELAAHFRAAHLPNRRLAMSIAAIGVAAGAAVVSIVALSQTQTQTPAPTTAPAAPAVVAGTQADPIMLEGKWLREADLARKAEGVPVLSDIPIVGSLFVSSDSKVGLTAPVVKLNGKTDAPTVRSLAAMLAENAGKRLSLTAGDTDVNKPLASVELVDADASTLLRVLNDRAGLIGPHRFDARFKGDVVEVAPLAVFDKQETSLIAYDLSAALNSHAQPDELIETVTQFVESDGWRENGGDTARLKVVGNKMFVEAPPRYHERVEWIIGQFSTPRPQRSGFAPKAAARYAAESLASTPAHASTDPVAGMPAATGGGKAPSASPFGAGSATPAPAAPASSGPFGSSGAATPTPVAR